MLCRLTMEEFRKAKLKNSNFGALKISFLIAKYFYLTHVLSIKFAQTSQLTVS